MCRAQGTNVNKGSLDNRSPALLEPWPWTVGLDKRACSQVACVLGSLLLCDQKYRGLDTCSLRPQDHCLPLQAWTLLELPPAQNPPRLSSFQMPTSPPSALGGSQGWAEAHW